MTTKHGSVSPELLAILVCPIDKQPVRVDRRRARLHVCGRRFPIENGIPNMLVDEDNSRNREHLFVARGILDG